MSRRRAAQPKRRGSASQKKERAKARVNAAHGQSNDKFTARSVPMPRRFHPTDPRIEPRNDFRHRIPETGIFLAVSRQEELLFRRHNRPEKNREDEKMRHEQPWIPEKSDDAQPKHKTADINGVSHESVGTARHEPRRFDFARAGVTAGASRGPGAQPEPERDQQKRD